MFPSKYRTAMGGFVYMMSNRKGGPLYTGVTANLAERINQDKNGDGSTFCRKYGLSKLVWCEDYDRIEDAIAREKQIKKWRRAWKAKLIEETNPDWADLYESLFH